MNYLYDLGNKLLNAPTRRLTAFAEGRYIILRYFDKAPDAGRFIASWGNRENHDSGVAYEDYEFVSAYDFTRLLGCALNEGVAIDERIPLDTWKAA